MDKHVTEGIDSFEEFMSGAGESVVIGKDGRYADPFVHACFIGWKAGRYAMYSQVMQRMQQGN